MPKIIVSSVASGQTKPYVGGSDIMMMHSVADIQGLNSITRDVLGNAAEALAGMVKARESGSAQSRRAIGLSMFGVTTPAVQQLTAALGPGEECLVFHATGVGGKAMEALVDEGRISALLDITLTEFADLVAGGVFPAHEDRLGAVIRSGAPWIGACGALDMVNFDAPETVPERHRGRLLHRHNPQVTLMRTSVEENIAAARMIGAQMNRMTGPARLLLSEGGLSALDIEGGPFHDRAANEALFDTLEEVVNQTSQRRLIRVKAHINDAGFTEAALAAFHEITGTARQKEA